MLFSFFASERPYSIQYWNYCSIMFKKSKLSKVLFLFLFLASLWQIDVAFLFAYGLLPVEIIDLCFRVFRIGSILVSPTLFYVAYTIYQEEFPSGRRSRWRFVMNKYSVIFFYVWGFIVYFVGWSQHELIDSCLSIQVVFTGFIFLYMVNFLGSSKLICFYSG